MTDRRKGSGIPKKGKSARVAETGNARPEMVFGLVGAIGVDLSAINLALKDALLTVGYRTQDIRVSDLLEQVPGGTKKAITDFDRLMNKGDRIRKKTELPDAATTLAVMALSNDRDERLDNGHVCVDGHGHATIVRSLKRQEEVSFLRDLYGDRFVLIGAWAPREEREKVVESRLRETKPGKSSDWYAKQINRLLDRDEKDDAEKYGQRLRATFQEADAYVAVHPGQSPAPAVIRLIRVLFGSTFETPNEAEAAMFHAYGASLRSSDAGRQVGCVLVDQMGDVIVTGVNEVPRPGGGQYWAGDQPDHRDFNYAFDINERQKMFIVSEILQLLKDAKWLESEKGRTEIGALAREALEPEGPLAESKVTDLLEFGRVAHAEMAAICTAARRGQRIEGSVLYCTTYPCHECARLIILSGISKVVYIDPYPKSQVPSMYRHEIAEVAEQPNRVVFQPFEGIAPRMFARLFTAKNRGRSDVTGEYEPWSAATAVPKLLFENPSLPALQILEDEATKELRDALKRLGWT